MLFPFKGGYMSAKVQKLENQFHSEAALQHQKDENSSSIFSGVAIFVNGFTGDAFIFINCSKCPLGI